MGWEIFPFNSEWLFPIQQKVSPQNQIKSNECKLKCNKNLYSKTHYNRYCNIVTFEIPILDKNLCV